jgi:hypothetical protein
MAMGEFANTGEREFIPPDLGEQSDWVLVLDDAPKRYPLRLLPKEGKTTQEDIE